MAIVAAVDVVAAAAVMIVFDFVAAQQLIMVLPSIQHRTMGLGWMPMCSNLRGIVHAKHSHQRH